MSQSPAQLMRLLFEFTPTTGQERFFNAMDAFLATDKWKNQIFVLKGYAGTGKTSLIASLIKTLPRFNYKSTLLAPTGRAAKVMTLYSGKNAGTIHKKIYRQVTNPVTGNLEFVRINNTATQTIYIIDEASMIADTQEMGQGGLLTDLIAFVFLSEDGNNGNKIVFVGDTAQLPPVGTSLSPALNPKYLADAFHVGVDSLEMTEVMRQLAGSGILFNATAMRSQMVEAEALKPNEQLAHLMKLKFKTAGFKDIYKMTGEKLEDGLQYAYRKFGPENTTIITRSNKDAVAYNRYIRQQIFYQEDEIAAGDMLMVVKNNYHFLPDDSKLYFLANGDFVEIQKIRKYHELHGLRFATAILKLVDYPEEGEFEANIILDTLYSDAPALTQTQNKALYNSVAQEYEHVVALTERKAEMRKDPFLNALQVKFAYALTCHKSQGGQWQAVFVDQGYMTDEMLNIEWLRWLYTGITRATKELYLMNFKETFFK